MNKLVEVIAKEMADDVNANRQLETPNRYSREEIFGPDVQPDEFIFQAKAAAKAVMPFIEKAIVDSVKTGWDMGAGDFPTVKGDSYFSSDLDRYKSQWLLENIGD